MLCYLFMLLNLALIRAEPQAPAAQDPRVSRLARDVHNKGWIVYSARTEQGDWDLFLVRPDGSHRHNLTNTPTVHELGGRFSPDGKKILYRRIARDARIRQDGWGSLGELVISNADGSNAVAIGAAGEFAWASWSPDGRQVVCLSKAGVEFVDLATRKVIRRIDRKGIFQQLTWSPDGRWLSGTANSFGDAWTVVRMNAVTGEVNPVVKFQNCTPDWFPDSKRLIYSSRPAGQPVLDGGKAAQAVNQKPEYGWTQLWMAEADGSARTLVYGEDSRHIYGGAISPDGKYVLFTRSPTDGGMDTAMLSLMRLSDAPAIGRQSQALRKLYPNAKNATILDLGFGWEPHWTAAEAGGAK